MPKMKCKNCGKMRADWFECVHCRHQCGSPVPSDEPTGVEQLPIFTAPNHHFPDTTEIRDADIPLSMLPAFKMGVHWNDHTYGYRKPFLTYSQRAGHSGVILDGAATKIQEACNLPSKLTSVRLSLILRIIREQEGMIARETVVSVISRSLSQLV